MMVNNTAKICGEEVDGNKFSSQSGKRNFCFYGLLFFVQKVLKNPFAKVLIIKLIFVIVILICWKQIPVHDCIPPADGDVDQLYPINELRLNNTINIALVGDSLVLNALIHFNLIAKLHSLLPEYKISFTSFSGNGWRISKILEVFMQEVLPTGPDGILLYWDSDVSDVFEIYESNERISQIRSDYVDRLQTFISAVKSANISLIGVGGPTILGEGVFGLPLEWWAKYNMLVGYRLMTKSVCGSNGVPYMDMRAAFLQALSALSSRVLYCGYLTWDGEHENEKGTEIVASLFSTAIRSWLLTTTMI